MKHECHVPTCTTEVPPTKLMCRTHWKKVPKKLKDAVWANYKDGQCKGRPSDKWLRAARTAITSVLKEERDE